MRCFGFEAGTAAAYASKDPDALLRVNDAGVALALGGCVAGIDFVPCPRLTALP